MKKTLPFLALITTLAMMPLSTASAGHNDRLVGRTPCGKPIYATHEVVGHDHCGRNIWKWVSHYPSSCHCRESRRNDYCREPRRYEPPCRQSGWSFFFRF